MCIAIILYILIIISICVGMFVMSRAFYTVDNRKAIKCAIIGGMFAIIPLLILIFSNFEVITYTPDKYDLQAMRTDHHARVEISNYEHITEGKFYGIDEYIYYVTPTPTPMPNNQYLLETEG